MNWKTVATVAFFSPLILTGIALVVGLILNLIKFLMVATWGEIAFSVFICWSVLCIAVIFMLGAANNR